MNTWSINKNNNYTIADIMICAMARMLNDNETAFHGVSSHMPMYSILLARALHAPNLVYLNIPGGVDAPVKSAKDYTTAGSELIPGSVANFPLSEVFDLSMKGRLDTAFLSGIQFDKVGNVNASVIGDYHKPKVRMPGGAGSAVLIPTAKKAIIWRTKHDKKTFVENVDFITTRGNIYRIVTPFCIFKQENNMLVLDSIHTTSTVTEVVENTGFYIENTIVPHTPPPTTQELALLKKLDPNNYRNIEFR